MEKTWTEESERPRLNLHAATHCFFVAMGRRINLSKSHFLIYKMGIAFRVVICNSVMCVKHQV